MRTSGPQGRFDLTVTAVVVNHSRSHLLRRCIESLLVSASRAEIPMQIIIVDNASTDGSRDMVRKLFPQVEVLQLAANRGFAAAVQHAMPHVRGAWLMLLNNDAELLPDALREMLSVARAMGSRTGAVAAQMRFAANPDVIDSMGIEVDRLGVAASRLTGQTQDSVGAEPAEVFGASGGAALLSMRMLTEVGGFDSRFFMYLEDADLAWRARVAGWTAYSAPGAIAIHHHAATAVHASNFKLYHVGLNRVRLLAKNAPMGHLLRYGLLMVAYDLSYIAYVLVTRRSLAPLRGRLAGIAQWRAFRDARIRDAGDLVPISGLRAALARHRAASAHSVTGSG